MSDTAYEKQIYWLFANGRLWLDRVDRYGDHLTEFFFNADGVSWGWLLRT